MMKRLTALLLSLIIAFSLALPAFAHNKTEHDRLMSQVLFGSKSYKSTLSKSSDEFKALEALEYAVALSIDQFNNNDKNYLDALRAMHIYGLPRSIQKINLEKVSHHRQYTHKGWNYDYSVEANSSISTGSPTETSNSKEDAKWKSEWQKKWEKRKTILLQTVNEVFDFHSFGSNQNFALFSKNSQYTEQCVAFAELLYYIHIIADIQDSDYSEGYEDVCKLAIAKPSANDPDIYSELLKILPVIFESQKNTRSYSGLISDIKVQASQARKFIKDTPDIKSNYSEYQKFADDLLDKLASKLPSLLQQEPFFRDVFYSNKVVNKAA